MSKTQIGYRISIIENQKIEAVVNRLLSFNKREKVLFAVFFNKKDGK